MSTDETKKDDKPVEEKPAASKRKTLRVPLLITKVKVEQNGTVFFGLGGQIAV